MMSLLLIIGKGHGVGWAAVNGASGVAAGMGKYAQEDTSTMEDAGLGGAGGLDCGCGEGRADRPRKPTNPAVQLPHEGIFLRLSKTPSKSKSLFINRICWHCFQSV